MTAAGFTTAFTMVKSLVSTVTNVNGQRLHSLTAYHRS